MTTGFAAIPNWMFRDERFDIYCIAVYGALASHSGPGGIYPSQETLASEAGCSVRKVISILRVLEEFGVIQRVHRTNSAGRASDGYVLVPNGPLGFDEVPASGADTARGAGQFLHTVQSDPAHGAGEEEPVNKNPIKNLVAPDESGTTGGVLIPDDWKPNQRQIDYATSLGLDVNRETARFRNHAVRTQRRMKNWNTGFTNWLRKAVEFKQQAVAAPKPMQQPRRRDPWDVPEAGWQKAAREAGEL